MKQGVTVEEARIMAKKRYEEINCYQEYEDAFYFFVNDGNEHDGGPQCGFVIMKEGGKIRMPYDYFLNADGEIKMIGGEILF